MKEKNLIILTVVSILLIALLAFISIGTQQTDNNTTNDTINLTLNDTNNTNNTTTETPKAQTQTKKKTQTTSAKKSDEPSVVSDSVEYNYQVDDGSYLRTVEYSDGSFKQYDMEGREISPGDMS